jgi:hypothetical protein
VTREREAQRLNRRLISLAPGFSRVLNEKHTKIEMRPLPKQPNPAIFRVFAPWRLCVKIPPVKISD